MKARFTAPVTAIVGLIILAALFRFGRTEAFGDRYLLVNMLGLFLAPMLVIFLVFRSDPGEFGFSLGDSRRVARFTVILYLLTLLPLILASQMKSFQQHYPISRDASASVGTFLYFEATYGMCLLCREFFFRGFLLFGLARAIGWGAIFFQAAGYGLMHYGRSAPEFAASFVAGLVLGWVALRAKSFVPSFLLHWALAVTFDAMVIGGARFVGG